jgi:hypothetical protein
VPFPLLAHQAPVIPLKAWRPNWFNGTALVIGSIAPDLQNFWNVDTPRGMATFGHTLRGQVTFCLPVTLSVVVLVGYLDLGEVIAARIGTPARWLIGVGTIVRRPFGILLAATSALCGSLSHVGLDKLTHDVVPRFLPHGVYRLRGLTFSTHAIIEASTSVICACLTIWFLRRWFPMPAATVPRRPGMMWLMLFGLLGASAAFARALPATKHPHWYFEAGPVYVWGYVAFLTSVGAFVGALTAAMMLAWYDRSRDVA